jgi:hypothetical protein
VGNGPREGICIYRKRERQNSYIMERSFVKDKSSCAYRTKKCMLDDPSLRSVVPLDLLQMITDAKIIFHRNNDEELEGDKKEDYTSNQRN